MAGPALLAAARRRGVEVWADSVERRIRYRPRGGLGGLLEAQFAEHKTAILHALWLEDAGVAARVEEIGRHQARDGDTALQLLRRRQASEAARWASGTGMCAWCLTAPRSEPDACLCVRCRRAFEIAACADGRRFLPSSSLSTPSTHTEREEGYGR